MKLIWTDKTVNTKLHIALESLSIILYFKLKNKKKNGLLIKKI